ncbi:MAG: hypothetical protein WCY93_11300 [Anaerolineaceae bacterium]
MILVDFSQVILASMFATIGGPGHGDDISEDFLRHVLLNSLKASRKKFRDEYGELVICCDDKGSWRRDVFPYYKANRRKSREESKLDWSSIFETIATLKSELHENFPYTVIQIPNAEADDIIGTICHEYGVELNNGADKILILSGDKDFIQLHKYSNVDQYNPAMKTWVRNNNPERYLLEHIARGDGGDGIPNVRSADNCLVVGERQKPITAKWLEQIINDPESLDPLVKARLKRNQTIIDLENTPDDLKEKILAAYWDEKSIGRSKLWSYFVEKKLKNLMGELNQF